MQGRETASRFVVDSAPNRETALAYVNGNTVIWLLQHMPVSEVKSWKERLLNALDPSDGVPLFNNWRMFAAELLTRLAEVLQPDSRVMHIIDMTAAAISAVYIDPERYRRLFRRVDRWQRKALQEYEDILEMQMERGISARRDQDIAASNLSAITATSLTIHILAALLNDHSKIHTQEAFIASPQSLLEMVVTTIVASRRIATGETHPDPAKAILEVADTFESMLRVRPPKSA